MKFPATPRLAEFCAGLAFLFFSLSAVAAEPDAENAGQKAAMLCAACHGVDGNSTLPANPVLAGQLPETLLKELNDFRRADGKPAARNNDVMGAMSAVLSDEDRRILSIYFSRQKPVPPTLDASPAPNTSPEDAGTAHVAPPEFSERAKTAQVLWRRGDFDRRIPACAGCHGTTGKGLPSQNPRVAGQHSEYSVAQLKNYRSGKRANDREKIMRTIAEKLSDKEIDALSELVAGLR
ncbi:MAG: c-type cytochrome [Candidatus Accumulibacter sp.]|jgi:cytochrome c553|nr:c-type cytochrome [Accumulibacter sp.]